MSQTAAECASVMPSTGRFVTLRSQQVPTLRNAERSRPASYGAKSAWLRIGLAIGTKLAEPLLHILDGLLWAGQLTIRGNTVNA